MRLHLAMRPLGTTLQNLITIKVNSFTPLFLLADGILSDQLRSKSRFPQRCQIRNVMNSLQLSSEAYLSLSGKTTIGFRLHAMFQGYRPCLRCRWNPSAVSPLLHIDVPHYDLRTQYALVSFSLLDDDRHFSQADIIDIAVFSDLEWVINRHLRPWNPSRLRRRRW